MARERNENGAVTSLNGTINDSTTTVAVADASVFSPLPQFRIIINSEIMLVTAIAGNNLTVERGAESSTAAAHNDGAVVAQIITKEGLQRYGRDWTPFFDDPNRKPYQLLDSAGATLELANFTWVNQGGVVASDMSSGGIQFRIPNSASENVRMLVRTAPAAPFTITAAFVPLWRGANNIGQCGVVIRDTGGEIVTMSWNRITEPSAYNFTNETTFSGLIRQREEWCNLTGPIWLRIEDDNTDHKFSLSMDGINFIEYATQGRLAHLGSVDQVGIYMANLNTGDDALLNLVAYHEE